MPEQFKDSPLGRIPKGWEVKSLAVLASEITSGATPTSGSARYYCDAGGLPFAKIDDLTASSTRFLERTSLQVTRAALRETALVEYPAGTLLLSMYGTIGLVKTTARPMCANQALAAIIPPFSCDPSFLAHVLEWSRPKWDRFKAQTTQANINGRIVKDFLLAVPPEDEQCRIADILDTVDDAIRQTERVIAKLERVKSGMLQDLLTRGIDDNGEVRDPDRHPEQFKDSPLGRIPKGWACVPARDVIERHFCGPSPTCEERECHSALEWGLLKTTAVTWEQGWSPREHKTLPREYWGLRHLAVQVGDVVVTKAGPRHRCGVVAWVDQVPGRLIVSGKMIGLRPISERILPRILAGALAQQGPQKYLDMRTTGMAESQVNFSNETLLAAPIAVPPHDEQHRIDSLLAEQDLSLSIARVELPKLRATKQAIADDLLTGRVRVNTRERVPA